MNDPTVQGREERAAADRFQALTAAVRRFVVSQLGLNPSATFVDEHEGSITVTLRDVLSDSERNGAKDRHTAELIARIFTEAFRSVRGVLLAECSASIGRSVDSATLFVDPRSNYASIILTLGK